MSHHASDLFSVFRILTAVAALVPCATLPVPLLAALPTSASFAVQNGTAAVAIAGTVASISTSDRAVLQWGPGNFMIAAGETYSFQVPVGGAVLNRVGTSAAADTATLAGQLDSNGRVFILAPGGTINVHQGAAVTAAGGLVLSTLPEDGGFFIATGNLVLNPSASGNGSISIGIPNPAPGASVAAPAFTSALTAVAGSLSLASVDASGDVTIRSVNAATALSLAANGNVRVLGNLTATATLSDITQAAGGTIRAGDTNLMTKLATFTTTGSNNITLDNAGNDFSNLSLNTAVGPVAAGAVVVKDVSDVYLSNSTLGGSLAVTAAGFSTLPAIATVGTLSVAGNADFSNTGTNTRTSVTISQNSTVGGVLSGTVSNNTSFSFTGLGNVTVGTISAVGGNSTAITVNTTGNVSLIAGAILSTQGNTTAGGGGINLTGSTVNTSAGFLVAGNATRAGSVSLNATAGNLTVGSISSNRSITLRAAAGNITQAVYTGLSSTTGSMTHVAAALGHIDLSSPVNYLEGSGVVQLSGASAVLTNNNSITLGTTNVTGNVTLNAVGAATNVTLGTGAGTFAQSLVIGGNLSINVINGTPLVPAANTGTIGDNNYSPITVNGAVNLVTSGGNVVLDAATANGVLAPSIRLGEVSVANPSGNAAGTVALAETTTLNLGNITATSLVAQSTQGSILDSGNILVSGAASFAVTANNSLTLDSPGNAFGSLNVAGNGQATVFANSSLHLASGTILTGNLAVTTSAGNNITVDAVGITGSLTLNSGGSLDFVNTAVAPATAAPVSVSGDLSLSAAGGAITQSGFGGLTVGGTTSVSAGNATVAQAVTLGGANELNAVVLNNSTGAVTINDVSNLTISGSAAGTVTAKAGGGTLANTWALTLGNLTVGALVAEAANGSAGASGPLTQLPGTSVNSFGQSRFTVTSNNIVLGNSGNNFGRLELFVLSAGDSRTVTVVEDGTMRLGNLSGRGNSTLTSRFGSIVEDADANTTVTNNGTLFLNAPNGSVLIGNTTTRVTNPATGLPFTTTGNVVTASIIAPGGAAAVQSTANLTLGVTEVNSLVVTSGNNILQSAAISVFGPASFKATHNITLTNAGNNFGRVSLETTTASRNLTITEAGTLNLGTVKMPASATGSFTATSVAGDIIDTGLANLRPGGTITALGSGVVTLTASAGNIVLDDPTTDFPTTGGVVFAANNVTLAPAGAVNLVLGSLVTPAVVTGNLTVATSLPTGNIVSAGSVQVGGDAAFLAANANVSLTGTANRFGTLRFLGQQVSIYESDDTVLTTGSASLQSISIFSAGSIQLLNRGGIISLEGVSTILNAGGSITLPKLLQVRGSLTVGATGTKDLGALSLANDLSGKAPINVGPGVYVPPGP